jgi:hypothetical protein
MSFYYRENGIKGGFLFLLHLYIWFIFGFCFKICSCVTKTCLHSTQLLYLRCETSFFKRSAKSTGWLLLPLMIMGAAWLTQKLFNLTRWNLPGAFFFSSNVLSPAIFHRNRELGPLSLGVHHSFLAWTKNPFLRFYYFLNKRGAVTEPVQNHPRI